MEDHLSPEGTGLGEVHGYGHYHDTYVKQDGRWLVKARTLTRLHLDVTR